MIIEINILTNDGRILIQQRAPVEQWQNTQLPRPLVEKQSDGRTLALLGYKLETEVKIIELED